MIFGKVSSLRATLKSNADFSVDFIFSDDFFRGEAIDEEKPPS
jgi:hypothetical protein